MCPSPFGGAKEDVKWGGAAMHIRDLPKVEAVLKGSTGAVDFVVVRFENYKRFVRKCKLEGSINEAEYLARYKDVEKSIKDGKVRTATEHYLATGYVEQRVAQLVDSPDAQAAWQSPAEVARAQPAGTVSDEDDKTSAPDHEMSTPDEDDQAPVERAPSRRSGARGRSALPLARLR